MNRAASVLQSARREAAGVMLLWLAACVYTVGFAALYAYRQDPEPWLVGGMPGWVVWGVLAPWAVTLAFTVWYSFWGIRDEDLGEERSGPDGSGHAPGGGASHG